MPFHTNSPRTVPQPPPPETGNWMIERFPIELRKKFLLKARMAGSTGREQLMAIVQNYINQKGTPA